MLNENNEYEIMDLNNKNTNEQTIIEIRYDDLEDAFKEKVEKDLKQYEKNAYLKSPLKRVIPKYKNYSKVIDSDLKTAYMEDLILKTLNELYNNNLPVKYNAETEIYTIFCKAKNINNVFSVTQAVFKSVFSEFFDKMPHFLIKCDVLYD